MVSPLDDFRSALRRSKPTLVVMTGGLLDPHNIQLVRELLWDDVAVIGFADVRDPAIDERLQAAGLRRGVLEAGRPRRGCRGDQADPATPGAARV